MGAKTQEEASACLEPFIPEAKAAGIPTNRAPSEQELGEYCPGLVAAISNPANEQKYCTADLAMAEEAWSAMRLSGVDAQVLVASSSVFRYALPCFVAGAVLTGFVLALKRRHSATSMHEPLMSESA